MSTNAMAGKRRAGCTRKAPRLFCVAIALPLVVVVGPPAARAQAAAAKAAAESQALFEEAMALIKSGQYAEACPKLEASLQMEAGVGTRYYLADCYQHTGKTASAYAMFRNTEEVAKDKAQRDEARQRAKALEPRLVRVVVDVPENVRKIAGLVVQRGGEQLSLGQFGTAVPVDPASIPISATATGKKRWEVTLSAVKEGATLTVQVPMLEDLPASGTGPVATAAGAPSFWSGQRVAGLSIAAFAVVSLGVGSGLGLTAIDKKNASETRGWCSPEGACTDPRGLALRGDGRAAGDASTVMFILGGALLAGGAVLYFTAPGAAQKKPDKPAVTAFVGAGSAGVAGRW